VKPTRGFRGGRIRCFDRQDAGVQEGAATADSQPLHSHADLTTRVGRQVHAN
jgi:hypothetical protein